MKIVVITNSDIGLFRFRKELIQALLGKGHQVNLIMPSGSYTSYFIKIGCNHINLNIDRRGKNLFRELVTLGQLFRHLVNTRPDMVLTYTIKPNLYGGLLCRLLKTKYICNITGLGTTFQKKGFLLNLVKWLYRISVSKASWVFVQNSDIYKILQGAKILSKDNFSIIPGSGVNLEEYEYCEPNREDIFRFLFLGRLMKEKGIYELLEAAVEVRKIRKNVIFDLVGMIDEDIDMNKYICEGIAYHGETKEPEKYYRQCTCLINPSYHEGMANVVLEACATGRPCLVSDINGCKEIVKDGYNGFLFAPGDAKSLQDAILRFVELDNHNVKVFGNNARKMVEQSFDRNNIINDYLNRIERLDSNENI